LRAELLAAEQEARNRKRKAEGKPPLPVEGATGNAAVEDDEANKRRKLLQEALEMDKDDDSDANSDDDDAPKAEKKKEKAEEDRHVPFTNITRILQAKASRLFSVRKKRIQMTMTTKMIPQSSLGSWRRLSGSERRRRRDRKLSNLRPAQRRENERLLQEILSSTLLQHSVNSHQD
jgi:hypothetical protein